MRLSLGLIIISVVILDLIALTIPTPTFSNLILRDIAESEYPDIQRLAELVGIEIPREEKPMISDQDRTITDSALQLQSLHECKSTSFSRIHLNSVLI